MKPDPKAFGYLRKKFSTKRHWPKILLAAAIGAMVPIILTQNKQSTLEVKEALCADIHQSAKIAKLNYLLGNDKEEALRSIPVFKENQEAYYKVVHDIYSQDYQPHPLIKEVATTIIVSDTYFNCIKEYMPALKEHLDDN